MPKQQQKAKPGRPKNPEITRIATKFGVSRARAHQLSKEIEDSGGGETNILQLRCKRLEQQIESAELELAKIRSGEEDVIPAKRVREAIEAFVAFASVFARGTAGEAASRVVGKDNVHEIATILEDFADAGTHAGFGAWLVNCPEPLRTIFCEELAKGDHRHERGDELRKTCEHNALCVALAMLAEEQK